MKNYKLQTQRVKLSLRNSLSLNQSFIQNSNTKMFSNQPEERSQSSKSQLQIKRQNFSKEIRQSKRNDYKKKLRAKFIYGSQVNYNLLHKIDLKESMNILNTYISSKKIHQQRDVDDYWKVYDLDLPENDRLKKAIQDIFLYVTSSMSDHAINLLEETHISSVTELLDRKIEQIKPLIKVRSLKQLKKNKQINLSLVYQKLLVILAHWSYDIILQEAYLSLIHVLNELIQIFPLQTRVVQCAMHCLANSLDKPKAFDDIFRRLNEDNLQNCVLSKIVQILQFQTKNLDEISFHSTTVISSFLNFFAQLFRNTNINSFHPQIKRKIYKSFHRLLVSPKLTQDLNLDILRTLCDLYSKNFGPLSHILQQTQQIFMLVVDLVYSGIITFNGKQFFEKRSEKKQILALSFQIVKTVFQNAGSNQQAFDEVCEFLSNEVDDKVDQIMQQGLKSKDQQILSNTLELIKYVCLWGDFISTVLENNNIMIKLFYFCQSQNVKLKKQAILCVINIVEGYFQEKNFYDAQLCEIYETIFQRFKFLETLVNNIDIHYDMQLNTQILNIVKIMSQFWQADYDFSQRPNAFWMKFIEFGGELKLNRIVTEDRNEQLQKKAIQILDIFTSKQIQI